MNISSNQVIINFPKRIICKISRLIKIVNCMFDVRALNYFPKYDENSLIFDTYNQSVRELRVAKLH